MTNLTSESLQRLASTIDTDLGVVTNDAHDASIIRVLRNGEVGVRPIDTHPVDALVGFVAPDDWQVFGVITYGYSRLGDNPESLRVRVVHLADRDGRQASALRFAYEENSTPITSTPAGRVPDCLARALNVATPAPDLGSTEEWDAVRWAVTAGERNHPTMDGAVAAWMDAGMFARFTLADIDTFAPGQLLALLGRDFMAAIVKEVAK